MRYLEKLGGILKDIGTINPNNKQIVEDESLDYVENARYGKQAKELLSQLEELKNELDRQLAPKDMENILPKTPNYEQMTFDLLTDQEIDELAKTLSGYSEEERAGIATEYENKISQIKNKKDNVSNERESLNKQTIQMYEDLKKRLAEKNAVNGIAHSSIATLTDSKNESEKSAALSKLNANITDMLSAYDVEIDNLYGQKELALSNYDTLEATKIEKQRQELLKQRQLLEEKALKYNNSLAEREKKFYVDREKEIASYKRAFENETNQREIREYYNGYEGISKQNYDKRIELLENHLNGLSEREQMEFFKGNKAKLKLLLGYYYDEYESRFKED